MKQGLNRDEEVVSLQIDLSKAFDRVEYKILLDKLEIIGIRGAALEILTSYLTNRKQRVVSRDEETGRVFKSKWINIQKGVPQGSNLGPLLFLLYINDAPQLVDHTTPLFADDTNIVIRSNKNEIEINVENTLLELTDYFASNNLLVNSDKTCIINYNPTNKLSKPFIRVGITNTILTQKESSKFLGITIDHKLNFKVHVEHLVKGINSYNYALKVIAKEINLNAALSAYYGYVHSRLTYCVIFWGNSPDSEKVFSAQKSSLRSIFSMSYRASCRDTFSKYSILTLPCIYIFESVKFIENHYDEFFKQHEITHIQNTRAANRVELRNERPQYDYIKKSSTRKMLDIYNKYKILKQRCVFKSITAFKNYLKKQCFYSVEDYIKHKI